MEERILVILLPVEKFLGLGLLRGFKMLYVSSILIEYKDIETFEDFLTVVKEKARQGERFIRFDLKPPYPDTPEDWQEKIESAFSGYLG